MPKNNNLSSGDDKKYQEEVGFVIEAHDYLFYLEGLPSARVNDLIISKQGSRSLITGLERERVEAMLLDQEKPKPGDMYQVVKEGLKFTIGPRLLGRALNPLGKSIDGKGNITGEGKKLDLDVIAPGIFTRELITEQLITGFAIVDTLMPIGKGQRELIFGEPRSGKTSFFQDVIINQKNQDVICVYAAIGKPEIDIKRFVNRLKEAGGLNYTVIVAASSSESAPVISIAPDFAYAVAEYFRDEGKDVLLILDDLGTHAKFIREISLLSDRSPGRESYPGEIFYIHAHNLERAGNFNKVKGGGSITLLPVIETDLENFTALIPTNLMASTDGHLFFSASYRAEGRYPAIDVDRSVTRVGHKTQLLLHKILSDKIRSLLAEYEELKRFSRFGAEITAKTQQAIKKGQIIQEMLKQESIEKINPFVQMILLSLVFTPFFDDKELDFIRNNKIKMLEIISKSSEFINMKAEVENNLSKMSLDEFINLVSSQLPVLTKKCQP